jgi:hypothetical protein
MMCGHARTTEFCPEGQKTPEPITEVRCMECGHTWRIIGEQDSTPEQRKMELRTELKVMFGMGGWL